MVRYLVQKTHRSGWDCTLLKPEYIGHFHGLIGCCEDQLFIGGGIYSIKDGKTILKVAHTIYFIEKCVYKTLIHYNDEAVERMRPFNLIFTLP